MRAVLRLLGVAPFCLATVVGCEETAPVGNTPEGDPADCDLIAGRCHPYEGTTDPTAAECHDIGHEGSARACTEHKAECLAACPEIGGSGGGGAGGSSSGGAGAGGGTVQGGSGGTPAGGNGVGGQGGMGAGATGGNAGSTTGGNAGSAAGSPAAGAGGAAGTSGAGAGSGAGGTGGVAGSGGGGACAEYCDCMDEACSDVAGYPLGTRAACLQACSGFSAAELSCWAYYCEEARGASAPGHSCEHAWGANDLDECP